MKFRVVMLACMAVVSMSGCIGDQFHGPTYVEFAKNVKAPAAGYGRIYVYSRLGLGGHGAAWFIEVDGERVGYILPAGLGAAWPVFAFDYPAGSYNLGIKERRTIFTTTKVGMDVTLAAGETLYILVLREPAFAADSRTPFFIESTDRRAAEQWMGQYQVWGPIVPGSPEFED